MVLTGSLWIQAFDFLAQCFNANCHFADAIVANPELLRLLAEDFFRMTGDACQLPDDVRQVRIAYVCGKGSFLSYRVWW